VTAVQWRPADWHVTTYHRVAGAERLHTYIARCDCGWHSEKTYRHGVDAHRAAAKHWLNDCPYPR